MVVQILIGNDYQKPRCTLLSIHLWSEFTWRKSFHNDLHNKVRRSLYGKVNNEGTFTDLYEKQYDTIFIIFLRYRRRRILELFLVAYLRRPLL